MAGGTEIRTEIRRWVWFVLGAAVAGHQTLLATTPDPWLLVFSLTLMSHPGVTVLAALLTPPKPSDTAPAEPPADDHTHS